MGIVACRAAYAGGSEWLVKLKEYLSQNLDFLRSFLREKLPQIKLVEPEGTYLVWLDCSALGLDDKTLEDFIVNEAGLWLDSGTMFGAGGEGFQRINIACPRAVLHKALTQLEQAVYKRTKSRVL
jgi:cystathionine beta-lyase